MVIWKERYSKKRVRKCKGNHYNQNLFVVFLVYKGSVRVFKVYIVVEIFRFFSSIKFLVYKKLQKKKNTERERIKRVD